MSDPGGPLPFPLPIEVRTAIEAIVIVQNGAISSHVIGDQRLQTLVRDFAPVHEHDDTLIALLATEDEIATHLNSGLHRAVIALVTTPMYDATRRMRVFRFRAARGRSRKSWANDGFRRTSIVRIQGPGSLAWMAAGRLATSVHRPDLYDRCRFNERRCIRASRWAGPLATMAVSTYRVVQ